MRENFMLHWRLLTFRATRAELQALDLRHLVAGVLWVWLVGVGRWWKDPQAGGMQRLGISSVTYALVLSFVLWLVFLPLRPQGWRYLRILTIVSLTAPPALLYSLPVERWLSVHEAAAFNLILLFVVALWRVCAWSVLAKRLSALPGSCVGVGTMLSLTVVMVGLTLQYVVVRGVLERMRKASADDLSEQAVMTLGILSVFAALPASIAYVGQVIARWSILPPVTTQTTGAEQDEFPIQTR